MTFVAKPLPPEHPLVPATPVGVDCVHAFANAALGPIAQRVILMVDGPADVVLVAVPEGAGQALALWLHEHLTIASVEGVDLPAADVASDDQEAGAS